MLVSNRSHIGRSKSGSSKRRNNTNSVSQEIANLSVKQLVNTTVKSLLAKSEEVKYKQFTAAPIISNAGANIVNIWSVGTGSFPLSPYTSYINIAQGTDSSTRIGNRITTKRATLELMLYPSAYNATTNPTPLPMFIKFWIYRVMNSDQQTAITTWFKQSSASSVGLAGTHADLMYDDNHDQLIVLHTEEIKIGFADDTGTGSVAGSQYRANNDFSICAHRTIDITPYLHKYYDFNDSTLIPVKQPITWFTIEAIPYTGTVGDVGSAPAQMTFVEKYYYTDA